MTTKRHVLLCAAMPALAHCNDGAETLLEEMCQDSVEGNASARPDASSFNIVLNILAKSIQKGSELRGEALLDRIIKLGNDSFLLLEPDVVSYNTVIDAYANAELPLEADERMFIRMHEDFKTGFLAEPPKVWSYNSSINAFAKMGDSGKAEALLKEMYKDFLGGNTDTGPN